MIAARRPESSLPEILGVVYRQRRKSLMFFTGVLLAALAALVLWPRSYHSESKLMVRLGRDNLALDPTATLGATQLLAVQEPRETEINSVLDIIHSRALIERVVDNIGPEVILGWKEYTGNYRAHAKVRGHGGNLSVASDEPTDAEAAEGTEETEAAELPVREKAIRWLNRAINAEASKKSNVLQVTCDARSPELAQAIVSGLIDSFLEEYIRLNRTPGTQQFLSTQTASMRERLVQRENELRQVKSETGLADPDQQRVLLIGRIGRLEDELLLNNVSLAASEAQVRRLREQLGSLSPREVTDETIEGKYATDLMRPQLYTLEMREQDLASRMTDAHPQLKQVREQLTEAKRVYDKEGPERTRTTTGRNKIYDELNLALLKEEPLLTALKAKAELITGQLSSQRLALNKLGDNEIRVARLQREVKLEETNYNKYAESLEQSRIDGALAAEGRSNISIVQPATFEMTPVKPNKALIFAAALVLGFAGSIGTALAAESMDGSVKSRSDIEGKLDLPMLAAIPRMQPQHSLAPSNGGSNGHDS